MPPPLRAEVLPENVALAKVMPLAAKPPPDDAAVFVVNEANEIDASELVVRTAPPRLADLLFVKLTVEIEAVPLE